VTSWTKVENEKDNANKDIVKELYADNVDAVRRYVYSLCRDNEDTNEVVQETYLTALRKASQFVPGTKFLSWVFSIARFKFLEQNRKNAKPQIFLSTETLEALASETDNNPFSEDQELARHKVQALKKCKEVLSQRNQEYLRLRYEEGLKPAKIAERFGLKPGTIHHALSKTRTFLKNCVETTLYKETKFPPPAQ